MRAAAWIFVVCLVSDNAGAEQITSTCRITAVDAAKRTVTLVRKTETGEGTGTAKVADVAEIHIGGKPATLEALKTPIEATVVYDTEQKALISIRTMASPPPTAPASLPKSFRGHTGKIISLAYRPQGDVIATSGGAVWDEQARRWAGSDQTVRLWSVNGQSTDPAAAVISFARNVGVVAFNPSGDTLAVTSSEDGSVRLYEIAETGPKLRSTLSDLTGVVFSIAISRDGKRLAAGSRTTGDTQIWDISGPDARSVAVLKRANRPPLSVDFSPDSKMLAVGYGEIQHAPVGTPPGEVVVWALSGTPTAQALPSPPSSEVRCVKYSPDGKYLIDATMDGRVRIWDAQSLALSGIFDGHASSGQAVISVAVSPDSKLAASCGYEGTVRLWTLRTRREILSIPQGAGMALEAIAFSPDGRQIAFGGNEKAVKIVPVPALVEE